MVFGDNTDFQIWHGGTHTFLKNTGGDLRIRGNKILLKTEDDGKTYIEANANQDVKLFYNNNEKLATALDGVNITGTLTKKSWEFLKTSQQNLRIFHLSI